MKVTELNNLIETQEEKSLAISNICWEKMEFVIIITMI